MYIAGQPAGYREGIAEARRVIASPRSGGTFRHGNRHVVSGRADRTPGEILASDVRYGDAGYSFRLSEPIPVLPASRPYRDSDDAPRIRRLRTVYVCPGCSIVPPQVGKCDNCW